jgi:Cu(I)/Ag(I) efflux system membrane fusion protein
MANSNTPTYRDGNGDLPVRTPAPVPEHGFWWKSWLVLKTIQARLRFIAILVAIGALIGFWDTLTGYYEKWTRHADAAEAADSDTEYFCPMHPYIVRDNRKEKCPICHMDLAKRKKGAATPEPLAPGTVSRVQLSPYRVVLAGVQTSEVGYQPLAKEITTFGSVEFNETTQAHIATRQKARIVKLHVNYTGQEVTEGEKLALLDVRYSPELTVTLEDLLRARQSGSREHEEMARKRLQRWDISDEQIQEFLQTGKVNTQLTITSPIKGHVIKKYQREGDFVDEGTPLYDVADLSTVWIEAQVYERDQSLLKEKLPVRATTLGLPGRAFRGHIDFIHPHLDEASRTLTVRYHIPNRGHQLRPGMYATVTIRVPPREIDALTRPMAEDWARRNTLDLLRHTLVAPGGALAATGLEPLLYTAVSQAALQQGLVLAVPESAVIDTGRLKIVYREAAPNTFEGVLVQLGPRMAEPGSTAVFYPVLRGLAAGDKVVTNGAFLVDAETRLNPAAGSIYYGGSGGKAGQAAVAVRPSTPEDEDALEKKARIELAKLSAADRRLAEEQRFCPILQTNRLGSMGPPVKIILDGKPVFLCCPSCEGKARANTQRTLDKVEDLKRGKSTPPSAPEPAPTSGEEAQVKANLAKLSSTDQPLAEAQKYCPITGERLGSPEMGTPVKIILDKRSVFLCCKGCVKEAQANAAQTMAKVEELKARARAEKHGHE